MTPQLQICGRDPILSDIFKCNPERLFLFPFFSLSSRYHLSPPCFSIQQFPHSSFYSSLFCNCARFCLKPKPLSSFLVCILLCCFCSFHDLLQIKTIPAFKTLYSNTLFFNFKYLFFNAIFLLYKLFFMTILY